MGGGLRKPFYLECYYSKMTTSEKLCLQWNEFQNIVTSAFEDLKSDGDLTDVTLACEDGKQIEAHKVVLAATSPFFLDLLKRNKHPNPLILQGGPTQHTNTQTQLYIKRTATIHYNREVILSQIQTQ